MLLRDDLAVTPGAGNAAGFITVMLNWTNPPRCRPETRNRQSTLAE
jgi:hypothetical protein